MSDDLIDSADAEEQTETSAYVSKAEERLKRGLMLFNRVMEEGTHYHTIRGKDTLSKIGAELIRMEFEQGVRATHDIKELNDKNLLITVKSEVFDINTDKVRATGLGVACTDEKDYDSLGIAANTCIKMAEKRANIDATINANGLTEIFSQDLDEFSENDLNKAKIIKSGESGKGKVSKPPVKSVRQAGPAAPKSKAKAATKKESNGDDYREWWASLKDQDRETLNEAEMHYRGEFDKATTINELEAVGKELGEQGFPKEFLRHLGGFYTYRKTTLNKEE